MSTLLYWFTSPEWAQVVKALLHSLWQGALLALVLAIVLRRLSNPVARYRCSLAALVAVVFATILTWSILNAASHRALQSAHRPPLITPRLAPVPATFPDLDSTPDTVVLIRQKTNSIRWTAWLAFAWLAGAILMMTRAGIKVAGAEQLRRSCRPLDDARIQVLLTETRRALGLARRIRVGITDKLTSPAVVGVIVPMLILPLALLTTLTPEQIRFVLLHELAHIRRRDYLANLFQFFAESLLFFNPAIWWISHQIRREREACCDALATALSGAPADYAQTLVRVAEQILCPAPAAAPAFGNKREPSTLAERIQRLLIPGYRPSLQLTWRAMLAALIVGGVLLFSSAVGTRLTMAAVLTTPQTTNGAASNAQVTANVQDPTAVKIKTAQLVQDGKLMFEIGKIDESKAKLNEALNLDPNNQDALYYLRIVKEQDAVVKRNALSGLQTPNLFARSNIVYTSPQRQKIYQKLNNITFDNIAFTNLQLSEVVRELAEQTELRDPDKEGVLFVINKVRPAAAASAIPTQPAFDPTTGQPIAPAAAPGDEIDPGTVQISLDPGLKNVRLMDVLEAITKSADHPIKYSMLDYGIEFSLKTPQPPELFTRTFKVDPSIFLDFFVGSPGVAFEDNTYQTQAAVINLFASAGVKLNPPKSVFFSDRRGTLTVHATAQDLDDIEECLSALSTKTGADGSPQTPVLSQSRTNLGYTSPLRQKTLDELKTITLDRVIYPGISLSEVIRSLNLELEQRDPDHHGFNFVLDRTKPIEPPAIDSQTGTPAPAWTNDVDLGDVKINLDPGLKNVQLLDLLEAIVKTADHPIQFSVLDYGVEFYFHPFADPPAMLTRTFQVDPNQLLARLGRPTVDKSTFNRQLMQSALFEALTNAGFKLPNIFFASWNYFTVRTTVDELKGLEKLVSEVNGPTGAGNMPANPATPSPVQNPSRDEVAKAVQDGKVLFQIGKLDEAEAKLQEALQSDPDNQVALYYLNLIKQTRVRNAAIQRGAENLPNVHLPYGLVTRIFEVDSNQFYTGLKDAGFIRSTGDLPSVAVQKAARRFFAAAGIYFSYPKTIDYDKGTLTVFATTEDMDLIEAAIDTLNHPKPPTVTVKARFVEVDATVDASGHVHTSANDFTKFLNGALTNNLTDPASGAVMGVLSESQVKSAMQLLRQTHSTNFFTEPQVITLSGRQAKFEMVNALTVVDGLKTTVTNGGTTRTYQTTNMNFGVFLDVVPSIAPDGQSISMKLVPSLTEFLGYEKPAKFIKTHPLTKEEQKAYKADQKPPIGVQWPIPKIRTCTATAEATVADGQTVVLGNLSDEVTTKIPDGKVFQEKHSGTSYKQLLVFVTAKITRESDTADARIHPDDYYDQGTHKKNP